MQNTDPCTTIKPVYKDHPSIATTKLGPFQCSLHAIAPIYKYHLSIMDIFLSSQGRFLKTGLTVFACYNKTFYNKNDYCDLLQKYPVQLIISFLPYKLPIYVCFFSFEL